MVEEFRAAKGAEPPVIENKVTITHGVGGGVITAELNTLRLNMVEIAIDMAVTKLGLPTDIPYATRRAEGLTAIAKFFVEHADTTTTIRGTRPHVSVIIDIETLENRANRPCRLENGDYLTGEQARQLCCDARITRIVTGPRSQPLDIGTQSRTFTPGMARAIIARDKHCTHTGCQAPPWACDIHHTQHVTNNGHTSTDNGELKCWHHHDWQHQHDRQPIAA